MLDHIGFSVSDCARSKAFYEQAMTPLGIGLVMEVGPEHTGDGSHAAGFGANGATDPGHVHIALLASTRAVVDAFHRAAIAAGGRDNGAPGLRPHYHPNYYGTFVLDPDGHNIEAVCHIPEA
jgi:catechol 2,3-dioxygenase-like lactoylglutathione lyase family enzyme